MRAGVAPNEVNYEFWRDPFVGSFWFGRWDANTEFFEVLASTDDHAEPYVEGEEWILKAGIVGSDISLKYWRPSELEPSTPQLAVVDTGLPPFQDNASRVELAVTHYGSRPAFPISASFDDVYFTPIPEPSSFGLALAAVLAGLAMCRRVI